MGVKSCPEDGGGLTVDASLTVDAGAGSRGSFTVWLAGDAVMRSDRVPGQPHGVRSDHSACVSASHAIRAPPLRPLHSANGIAV
jgi:hypothetical protein